MARKRGQTYRSSELSDLSRQMLYAPPERRADVVERAEHWHDEIDPQKNYPIDYVVYRLTQRRVPPSESVMLVGEALAPDLRLLIDALSRSIAMQVDSNDPAYTTAQWAERLGVSTKTIGRWRDAGLRWRWVVQQQGSQPTVVITQSAMTAFETRQSRRMRSASRFSRMDDVEQHRLIERARRLADVVDAPPMRLINHLSRRTSRSPETIRQLIRQHDESHPGSTVFDDRAGPLSDKQKRVIDRAYLSKIAVSKLCKRFRKTRSTIYRAIHEARARRISAMKIVLIDSPIFKRDDADEVILRPIPSENRSRRLSREVVRALPDSLQNIYDRPIDTDSVSRSLIVRYNYLKHRARLVQSEIVRSTVRASDLDRFDELWERVGQTRGRLLAGLLQIVLSVVRRQDLSESQNGQSMLLLAMLDRGHAVLIDEIERFDTARSHTLESVLTNRLLRELVKPDLLNHQVDEQAVLDRLAAAGFNGEEIDGKH